MTPPSDLEQVRAACEAIAKRKHEKSAPAIAQMVLAIIGHGRDYPGETYITPNMTDLLADCAREIRGER